MPEVSFVHIDDVPYQEVRAQLHGERRVGVHLKFLEMSPTRTVIYTKYDPGNLLEEHGHSSDHVLYILAGSLKVGETECRPGTMVLLPHGAFFGPLEAGPEGTELLEFYTGDVTAVPADPDAYERLLAERGIVRVPSSFEQAAES